MKQEVGNLWDFYDSGDWIAITTNSFIKKNGGVAMGRGCALEARLRYPQLPFVLAAHIKTEGNIPLFISSLRIVSFPVKTNWWDKADLELIKNSAIFLVKELSNFNITKLIVPRTGCGMGGLKWSRVQEILDPIFDDRFIVITNKEENEKACVH